MATDERREVVVVRSWMRLAVAGSLLLVLIHLLRPPDVIVPPDVAQDLWPDPPQPRLPPVDLTLVEAAEMEGWASKPVVVTAEEVRTDPYLWRRMFFYNWDLIGNPLREEGLLAMHRRYRHLLHGPAVWSQMDAEDWDAVPQAMRAMAVLRMIDCRALLYRPGEDHGLPLAAVADRLKAIAMLESWFQHRAVNENDDGSRDIGIAQASDYMRSRMRVLYVRGRADFGLAEDDYSDPWKATRALVFWFCLLLDEVGGDLDRATGAYHVGSGRARGRRARAYRDEVNRLENSYFGGAPSRSPAWDWLHARRPLPCPLPGSASEPPGSPQEEGMGSEREVHPPEGPVVSPFSPACCARPVPGWLPWSCLPSPPPRA